MNKQLRKNAVPPLELRLDEGPGSRPTSTFFKALSDETRQKILLILEENASTVGNIVSHFELAQPTISRHLSVLKDANLVVATRKGQNVIYRLDEDTLAHSMASFFSHFRQCRDHLRQS